MSEHPENYYSPFPPVEQRSARFLVEYPERGWVNIGQRRWSDIQHGGVSVPECAGRILRSAWATVQIDGRKVVALNRVEISNWRIGENGFADQEDRQREIARYVNMKARPADYAKTIPTLEDIVAIRRCLGLNGS
jgi:hypothetical protein